MRSNFASRPSREGRPSKQSSAKSLPLKRPLTQVYRLSLLVAGLTATASIAGIQSPNAFYPTPESLRSFLANDLINLLVGLPILLGSMVLARRGQLAGLLFWPGALLYGVYNYLVYLIGIPLNPISLIYLGIIALNAYAILGLVAAVNGNMVREQLDGRVREKLSGGYLLGFGALFLVRAVGLIVGAISSQTTITRPELGLLAADALLSLAWIVGGIMLWRRRERGYVLGAGFLFQSVALFPGLILLMLLQPVISGTPLIMTDLLVVIGMALICSVPFALYTRGILQSADHKGQGLNTIPGRDPPFWSLDLPEGVT